MRFERAARNPSAARLFRPGLLASCGLAVLLVGVVALAVGAGPGEDEAARRDKLNSLSVTEKEELRRKRERFERLDDAEKERLRRLHARLVDSPNRRRLHEVMLRYHEWLKTLSAEQRADLLRLPPEEKIDEIRRLMQQQRSQRFREFVNTPLAPEDVRAIFIWLDQYLARHEEALIDMLSEDFQPRVRRIESPQMRRRMLGMALSKLTEKDDLPLPTDEDLQRLSDQLSPQAREALAEVPNEQKVKLVHQWVRAAVASRLTPHVSNERLLSFYREQRDKLDAKERERLEGLPREQFYQEIRRLYFKHRGPWRHRRDGDRGRPRFHFPRDRDRGSRDGRPHQPGETREERRAPGDEDPS